MVMDGGAREWKRVSDVGVKGMRSLCRIRRSSIDAGGDYQRCSQYGPAAQLDHALGGAHGLGSVRESTHRSR